MYGQSVFWRETMKPAKFLIFEGRVVIVFVFTFMHFRIWTVSLAIATALFFWYFERKGVSANSIMRFMRAKFIGRKRTARGPHEERTAIDFGFEPVAFLNMIKAEEFKEANAGKSQTTLFLQDIQSYSSSAVDHSRKFLDGLRKKPQKDAISPEAEKKHKLKKGDGK